jgi:hypothetical protein
MMKGIASLALLVALAGCSPQAAQTSPAGAGQVAAVAACPTGTIPMNRYELYFGGSIDEKDWQSFLDMEVTSRFPRGFTVVDAHGQWQESNGEISKEATRILIVVVPDNVTSAAYIGAIGTAYNDRFDQDTSLLVRANVCAGFVTGTPD